MQNELPKRKNIRLKGYDYSSSGMYFITICSEYRKNYFGRICCDCRGGALPHPVVELSNIGEIISEQWYELKKRYQNIILDQFVIMPNHIHGIIIIDNKWSKIINLEGWGSAPPEYKIAPTIGNIICAYKSITTKLSNKNDGFPGRIIWQRNYYDHIIRDANQLNTIRQYIINNPLKWQEDKHFN